VRHMPKRVLTCSAKKEGEKITTNTAVVRENVASEGTRGKKRVGVGRRPFRGGKVQKGEMESQGPSGRKQQQRRGGKSPRIQKESVTGRESRPTN